METQVSPGLWTCGRNPVSQPGRGSGLERGGREPRRAPVLVGEAVLTWKPGSEPAGAQGPGPGAAARQEEAGEQAWRPLFNEYHPAYMLLLPILCR